MKILQIKRVILNLFKSVRRVLIRANLKLDDDHHVPCDKDCIGALTHSGDEEFKENMPIRDIREGVLQDRDLPSPRPSLEFLERVVVS